MQVTEMGLASRPLLTLAVLLACVGSAFGQGMRVDNPGGPATKNVQNFLAPIPGASIQVCTSAATGTPCSPVVPTSPVTLCTDSTCSVAAPNPFLADVNGNWGAWLLPGTYKVSVTAPGVTGQLLTVTVPITPGGNIVFTGQDSFWQQVSVTVSTGTAPFAISSTTVVPNLNAQLHNGLTAPGSAIVGVSDTQTLTNKTLTGASNGNSVTLLCSSGPAAAITGNSSAQTFFSCTIPANAVANLKGIRVTATWSHSTGTAAVTYGMTLNGIACWPSNNSAATVGGLSQIANFIETGSTTGNVMTQQGFFSFTTTSLTGLAWTSAQTLAVTFNVANTDQITPLFLLVELIQ